MIKACNCRFIRLILACVLGISFAAPHTAGSSLSDREILSRHQDADTVLATISVSPDPIVNRIKKRNRAFSADTLQSLEISSVSEWFDWNLTPLRLLSETATGTVAGQLSPDIHDRAPPPFPK
jgi:hypothetical protein